MTITAGEVINLARDYHPALSTTNAPKQLAYRALTRFMHEIAQKVVVRVPGFLGQVVPVTFDASTFTDGIDLATLIPAGWQDLVDVRFLYDTSNPQSFVTGLFVPYEQRDIPHPIPAYTLLNNVLYLLGNDEVGQLETAYQNYSGCVVSYTPLATPITADASELTGYPDDAKEMFAAMLGAFWLRRLVDDPQYAVQRSTADYFDNVAEGEKSRWLGRVFNVSRKQSYYIREIR